MKKSFTRLLDRITHTQWFYAISLLFILPFAVIMYYEISAIDRRIDFKQKERMGLEYIQRLKGFLRDAQQDRGLTRTYLSGETSFGQKAADKHGDMIEAVRVIDEIDKNFGGTLKTTEKWNELKKKWEGLELSGIEAGMPREESFDAHTEIINNILSLIIHITDTSNLILDPYFDSYYMMDASAKRAPFISEYIGKLRALGASVAAKGKITMDEKMRIMALVEQIKPQTDMLEHSIHIISKESPNLAPQLEKHFKDTLASADVFLSLLNNKILNAKDIDIKPEDYFDAATIAIDSNFNLFDNVSLELDNLLKTRIGKLHKRKYLIISAAFWAAAVFIYIVMRARTSLAKEMQAEEKLVKSLTEQILIQENLIRTQRHMQVIAATLGEGLLVTDKNQCITFANPAAEDILGWTKDELMGKNAMDFIKCKCNGCPLTEDVILYKPYRMERDVFFSRKDGTRFPASYIASSIIEGEEAAGTVIAFHDVTERKKMENEIRASLKEKELLLKEVHHRVKNNLQIVSSLLNLQSAHIKGSRESDDIFIESQNRIKSMAIIHEKLYKSKDISMIDFTEYTRDLTDNLLRSYKVNTNIVNIKINLSRLHMDADTAIPLGLIINELVSNSLKYAFPDNRKGEILINIQPLINDNNGHFILIVSDNGIGFPEGLDFKNTKSLGLQLVNTLAGQMQGKIEFNRKHGTEFRITFFSGGGG